VDKSQSRSALNPIDELDGTNDDVPVRKDTVVCEASSSASKDCCDAIYGGSPLDDLAEGVEGGLNGLDTPLSQLSGDTPVTDRDAPPDQNWDLLDDIHCTPSRPVSSEYEIKVNGHAELQMTVVSSDGALLRENHVGSQVVSTPGPGVLQEEIDDTNTNGRIDVEGLSMGFSTRTSNMLTFLQARIGQNDSVTFESISEGIDRATVAASFFELLVLKTRKFIHVIQTNKEITIRQAVGSI